jgi:hypothetical protein
MSAGLVSFDTTNDPPPLVGNSSGHLTLLSLLVQNINISDSCTIGKPGDQRTTQQMIDAGEVLDIWLPIILQKEVWIGGDLFIFGNVDLTGDLTVHGACLITDVDALPTAVDPGSLEITASFDVGGNMNIAGSLSVGVGNVTADLLVNGNSTLGTVGTDNFVQFNGHIVSGGTNLIDAPTTTGVSIAGDPTATVETESSTDTAGLITLTLNAGNIAAGDTVVIPYQNSYSTIYQAVFFQPGNTNACTGTAGDMTTGGGVFATTTQSELTMNFTTTSGGSGEFQWWYFIIDPVN